jgi:hypothetical protein
MAGEKTQAELYGLIDAGIRVNGNGEVTAPIHNAIEKAIVNSSLNKKSGGTIQSISFYSSSFTLTDPLSIVYKGYVDSLIAAIESITQGTNELSEPLVLNGNDVRINGDVEVTDITKGLILPDANGSGDRYRVTILDGSFNFELLP